VQSGRAAGASAPPRRVAGGGIARPGRSEVVYTAAWAEAAFFPEHDGGGDGACRALLLLI
jgi:hypothetical protein